MFQSYLSEYSILEVETFRTRIGVPANVRNFELLVRTVHTYTYHAQ